MLGGPGDAQSGWFIDVKALPEDGHGLFQVITLACIYGLGLTYAANLISDGSELLLLVPELAGIVGSVVLPVLGAIPDGMIVLFSGLGPDAAEQLSVGVGALAGSTIMLLTIPWCLSIVGGRVAIGEDGKPNYRPSGRVVPELSDWRQWGRSGVIVTPVINSGSKIMMLTSLTYLILQLPAMYYFYSEPAQQVKAAKDSAALAFLTCLMFFSGYLYYSYRMSVSGQDTDRQITREEKMKKAILDGKISLLGLMEAEFNYDDTQQAKNATFSGAVAGGASVGEYGSVSTTDKGAAGGSLSNVDDRLKRLLKPFYHKYDTDKNGTLDIGEFGMVFSDMGEKINAQGMKLLFQAMDADNSGEIDFEEFVQGVTSFIRDPKKRYLLNNAHINDNDNVLEELKLQQDEGDIEEEEEEEDDEYLPEDLADLPPEEQQRRLKVRSFLTMAAGTALVLLLSDPMCDVLAELGTRTGIPSFYVAFVLAPLASNASEVVASYSYACKKTATTMTVSLSALEGAAIMNNSFVLSVFTLLIYTQGLAWEYFAETMSILVVQLIVGVMALKSVHTLWDGFFILLIFPASLVFVYLLQSMGWD